LKRENTLSDMDCRLCGKEEALAIVAIAVRNSVCRSAGHFADGAGKAAEIDNAEINFLKHEWKK